MIISTSIEIPFHVGITPTQTVQIRCPQVIPLPSFITDPEWNTRIIENQSSSSNKS